MSLKQRVLPPREFDPGLTNYRQQSLAQNLGSTWSVPRKDRPMVGSVRGGYKGKQKQAAGGLVSPGLAPVLLPSVPRLCWLELSPSFTRNGVASTG